MDQIFSSSKTIAVIGCSSKSYRTSHLISRYLMENGYQIIPINPNEKSVHGVKCLPSIYDIPGDVEVDIVNIFRNRKYTLKLVQDLVDWADETGRKPVIWTQLNVSTPEAKRVAEENGFRYVEDHCIMIEHKHAL